MGIIAFRDVSCFVCRSFGKDKTILGLPSSYNMATLERSLLMLGLPINPAYLLLARKSAPYSLSKG